MVSCSKIFIFPKSNRYQFLSKIIIQSRKPGNPVELGVELWEQLIVRPLTNDFVGLDDNRDLKVISDKKKDKGDFGKIVLAHFWCTGAFFTFSEKSLIFRLRQCTKNVSVHRKCANSINSVKAPNLRHGTKSVPMLFFNFSEIDVSESASKHQKKRRCTKLAPWHGKCANAPETCQSTKSAPKFKKCANSLKISKNFQNLYQLTMSKGTRKASSHQTCTMAPKVRQGSFSLGNNKKTKISQETPQF